IEFGLASVLGNGQIHTAIAIKVGDGTGALFAIDFNPGLLGGHRMEVAFPITYQKQPTPAIVASGFDIDVEKILRHENIFIAIAIEIGHRQTKSRRELRLDGQWRGFEMVATVQEQHGIERRGFEWMTSGKSSAQQLFDARRPKSTESIETIEH